MASDNVTVAIPTIPPRACAGTRGHAPLLDQAVASVRRQTLTPAGGISVALDVDKAGAAVTRQRALDAVRTEWVAFLDDDDYMHPNHLEVLAGLVEEHSADYAYSWFDGNDPFPRHRGRQMDPQAPHHTTMTVMVRTELAKEAGFLQPDGPLHRDWSGEDWQFTTRCVALGARFIGTAEITWHYRSHRGNTSGLPTRW